MRWVTLAFALSLVCTALAQGSVPAHNRPELTEPPPLPPPGDFEERARRLVQAIAEDRPELAHDLFLSREAFRAIKATSDPDRLYDRLLRAYDEDIHELHASLGQSAASAELVRFEMSRRRGWVGLREEANRLPYWAQRHSWLVVRAGGREHRIEVRTLIAWDDRWYITHLSEFH